MVERGDGARLVEETFALRRIAAECVGQHFDGDVTSERLLPCKENGAHPAGTERREN